jgi:two-component system sensor histidine kinase KdpD
MATIISMDLFGRAYVGGARRAVILTALSLAGSTVAIALLEQVVRVPNAAAVYLLAVLTAGMFGGTVPAIASAFGSFLLYDFLFVEPFYTLTIADPAEWLNLLLFLAVAIAIGRLAALQAERATEVAERAHEAQALFAVSRALATTDDLPTSAADVLRQLAASGTMDRLWLGLGPSAAEESIVADTGGGAPLPVPTWHVVLQRMPGDEPAHWARTHVAVRPDGRRSRQGTTVYRLRVEVPGELLGSLWALRAAGASDPDRAETRILSAAADQLGQAVRRERLVAEGLEAEVARRSEALMSALLDSVSHDLRTPLATIRAAAGSMLDEGVAWTPEERTAALRSIDAEAERMNRLVRNLLDLSRIEGGALHPELEPYDLDDLVHRVIRRIHTDRSIQLDLPADLPPLVVDDTYLDEVLTNLVENAVRYGGSLIRIGGRQVTDGDAPIVEVTVEDDGPGVPDADIGRLFDKFYRVRRPGQGSRPGMGIGLTVAQGLARAMRGDVTAARSELGGLAFRVRLPAVHLPSDPNGDVAAEGAGG